MALILSSSSSSLPSSLLNHSLFLNSSISNPNSTSHFNHQGLTKTTATLTPTRLKNIEEQFLEQSSSSLLPPEPFQHDHMAGFVPPNVNIKLNLKPLEQTNFDFDSNESQSSFTIIDENEQQSIKSRSLDFYSSKSNSNESSISNQSNSDSLGSNGTNQTLNSVGVRNFINFANIVTNLKSFNQQKMPKNSNNNNVSCNTKTNKQRSKNKTKSKTIANASSSSSSSIALGKRSSHKKFTNNGSGGRKPNHSQNLTPEEDLKRQKRRERNKLAAARCRKKRIDQTNYLIEQTKDLQKHRDYLLKEIENLLTKFQKNKTILENHETQCCQFRLNLAEDLSSQLDMQALNIAMEPIPEEELDNDLNPVCYPLSPQTEIEPQPQPPSQPQPQPQSAKRKRPNSLVFRPMIEPIKYGQNAQQSSSKSLSLNDSSMINTKTSLTGSQTGPFNLSLTPNESNNVLITPSNGLLGDLNFEHTGLTPLNPTLTSVDLTPSTMTAFLKSITSPMEDGERKKLFLM
ncbi:basic leucine zipper transcriptional factor-like protein [Sarcoptes scabiei]|uniref:Basic leucine zipper transcriptional factor-like protein n=1 Tax=Sarcoptes scabiei TaxID=52283 RepID=A0A131ZWU3_SARSC|nr:basic leucine zipper transcriptional factor-like protein [Sarcoptes scabiei]